MYLNSLVSLQKFRLKAEQQGTGTVIELMGSMTGAITCGSCALFESLYYTNRDVMYWVTINNTAVPLFLITLAMLISSCLYCKIERK